MSKKTELSTNNLVKKKQKKLLKLKNRYVIKAADLAPFLRYLTLLTQISWLRIIPGKYFKNFFTFFFILFHSIAFLLVFLKIINENTSKFPLTTISAPGSCPPSSALYLFLLFLSSNCKIIYNS